MNRATENCRKSRLTERQQHVTISLIYFLNVNLMKKVLGSNEISSGMRRIYSCMII